jgi:hypothetical protein
MVARTSEVHAFMSAELNGLRTRALTADVSFLMHAFMRSLEK